MAEDQVHALFGSDSEDEQQPTAEEPVAQLEKEVDDATGVDDVPVAENGGQTREEQLRDLFGSDDEEDENPPAEPTNGTGGSPWQRESTPPEEPIRGPPMVVEVPLNDVLSSDPLRLAKLSNILAIEPRPFDPATYELEEAEYVDERGHKRVRLVDANAIRWRWAPAADGTLVRESNTRMVRWSDGSVTLVVGDEVMDAREIDVGGDNGFLFVRHPNLIQGQTRMQKKMVFRPSSLTSGSHRRLAAAVDKHHGTRQQRVRATTTLVDPKKEKEDREKAAELRIRDKERLVEKQQRTMKRYAPVAPSAQPRTMLSAAYLEEDEEEDEEDDGWLVRDDLDDGQGGEGEDLEESGDEEGGGGMGRFREGSEGPMRPRIMDDEEEAAAERRLAAIKAETGREQQQRGGVLNDSEEDISDADEPGNRDSNKEGQAGPTKRKRAVVMDSDSE